jgi:hypothetical protein
MKKKTDYWFPRTRAQQLLMFTNIKLKLPNYKEALGLSTAKIDRIILICDIFISVYNFVVQARATNGGLTDFQDLIFTAKGGTKGEPAPSAPVFQVLTMPAGAFVGIFDEFKTLVQKSIKTADGYSKDIGDDLMIEPAEAGEIVEATVEPDLKRETFTPYKIRLSGSMKGFKGLKVEYRKKGSDIPQTFFQTDLPAVIAVVPTVAGEAEAGQIRAKFIENNEEVGQWSPNYDITVAS